MQRFLKSGIPFIPLIVVLLALGACGPAQPSPTLEPTATPEVSTSTSIPQPTSTTSPQPVETAAEPTPAETSEGAAAPLPTPTLAGKGIPASYEEIQRISPEELKALIESGADVVVVDTQPEGAYDMGHIPGAINFPWAMEIPEPTNLPKDKLLILYCACMHEEDAGDVAMQLMTKYGYRNILLLDGGWLRWMELEYPVEVTEGGE